MNKLIIRLYSSLARPFEKYSESLISRFPCSDLHFRPLFVEEMYMAVGLWEPYVCRVLNLSKGDVTLDVGAHIGYYTLKMAKGVGNEGTVVSVEPDPRNFKMLKKNVTSNRLANVKLINCALGSGSGYATLKMDGLASKLVTNAQAPSSIRVQVKTMDELCQEIGIQRFDWIKIDVEGGACDVIRGGLKTLEQPTEIIIEVSDTEALDLLARLGYSINPLFIVDSKLAYYYATKSKIKVSRRISAA